MPTPIRDAFTLMALTQQVTEDAILFESGSSERIWDTFCQAYHLRCVRPYEPDMAHRLLGSYTITHYAHDEQLPPACHTCGSCQQKFYRSPKRQR